MSSSDSFAAPPGLPGVTAPVAPQMPVQTAIARAAAATGVDFTYLLAQARLESGLDPQARARTSSARGLYQFTGSTWLSTLDRHGADLGLAGASAHDPATRAQLLALRQDPQASALMAGELANDNRTALNAVLGRDPDNAELYLAHFLGPDAAGRFLSALSNDPDQSAAALVPKAAAANRAIFFAGASPRSVGQVMDLLRNRLDAASAEGFGTATPGVMPPMATLAAGPVAATPTGGPIAREFAAAADAMPAPAQASMADTLMSAFGQGEGGVTANVRQAYGRIRALGL
ncbi:lytic transglycosylase domain-containing protein [Novosphingobium sp. FSW06-99]|uniref:lytic transglycosylase domain-containing protein n=1 Tax=Novosphingobium sp. FSW06-99 TaxID=1739113 RepID=UPI000A65DD27|nr:lytic transglycosylase domain-containing protein [Novosphingobium sp. FSW06-99]